jgi:hypothetical protein
MIWFTDTLCINTNWGYTQYSAIADLHTLDFARTHALRFQVFTSRILATDLSQSHCNFNWHMKSYVHRLILFFPSNSSASKFISWPAGVPKLDSSLLDYYSNWLLYCSAEHLLAGILHGPRGNTTSIVKKVCFLIRCLAINVLFLRESFWTGMCSYRVVV